MFILCEQIQEQVAAVAGPLMSGRRQFGPASRGATIKKKKKTSEKKENSDENDKFKGDEFYSEAKGLAQSDGQAPICQFSAKTLLGVLELSRRSDGQATNHHHHRAKLLSGQRKSSLGSLPQRSAAIEEAGAIISPNPRDSPRSFIGSALHRRARSLSCNCCCCANECSSPPQTTVVTASQAPEESPLLATVSSNQLSRIKTHSSEQYSHSRAALNTMTPATLTTSTTAIGQGRWQKTARRPVPVPPPIVPLHKELAIREFNNLCGDVYHNPCSLAGKTGLTFILDSACRGRKLDNTHNPSPRSHGFPDGTRPSEAKAPLYCGSSTGNVTQSAVNNIARLIEADRGDEKINSEPINSGNRPSTTEVSRSFCSSVSRIRELTQKASSDSGFLVYKESNTSENTNTANACLEDQPNLHISSQRMSYVELRSPELRSKDHADDNNGLPYKKANVDINPQTRSVVRNSPTLPQATKSAPATTMLGPRKQHLQASLSAIYDLPESNGARELVRVDVSDGRRTLTAQRLPLRPALRPSMPPPPPPPPRSQQQQQRGSIAAVDSGAPAHKQQRAADGPQRGCARANFCPTQANPNWSAEIGTQKYSTKFQPSNSKSEQIRPQNSTDQIKKTISSGSESSSGVRNCHNDDSDKISAQSGTTSANQRPDCRAAEQQRNSTNVIRVTVNSGDKIGIGTDFSRLSELDIEQSKQPPDGQQKIPDNKGEQFSAVDAPSKGVRETDHTRDISNFVWEPTTKQERSSTIEGNYNMGSSHSSSQAATQANRTFTSKADNNNNNNSMKVVTARGQSCEQNHKFEGKSTSGSKQHRVHQLGDSCSSQNRNETSPKIIRTISSMTNKLVGEVAKMTPKDGGVAGGKSINNTDGQQHTQSALQMCLKGVKHASGVGGHHKHQATKSSDRNNKRMNSCGNHSKASATNNQRNLKQPQQSDDSSERRSSSLENGDVFIYPRLYKDLNECRKCLRDNRICNCIEIELSSDGSSSMEKVLNQPSSSSILAHSPLEDSYMTDCKHDSHSLANNCELTAGSNQSLTNYDDSGDQCETVYSISIATGSSEQGSNQLRLLPPKIITPSKSSLNSSDVNNNNNTDSDQCAHGSGTKSNGYVIFIEERGSFRAKADSSQKSAGNESGDTASSPASHANVKNLTRSSSIAKVAAEPQSELDEQQQQQQQSCRYETGGASAAALASAGAPARMPPSAPSSGFSQDSATMANCRDKPSDRNPSSERRSRTESCGYSCTRSSSSSSLVAAGRAAALASPEGATAAVSSRAQRSSLGPAKSRPLAKVEAKVTKISIGSPTNQANRGLDSHSLLGPELVKPNSASAERVSKTDANNNDLIASDSVGPGFDTSVASNSKPESTSIFIEACNSNKRKTKGQVTAAIMTNNDDDDELRPVNANATNNKEHTSIIPIQARRRNMANKPSRKAVYEDDYDDDGDEIRNKERRQDSSSDDTMVSFVSTPIGPNESQFELQERGVIVSDSISIGNSLSPKDNLSEVLDYSPILSSVRDYIKNMNTELQVQTSVASSQIGDGHDDMSGQPTASGLVRGAIVSPDTTLVVSSPKIQSSVAATLLEPIQVTSTSTGIVQATFTAASVPAASIKAHVGSVDVESPKKSIFDGASKDEILEYLEDARERVPEILMAADDVMVISENELIVVNQLEPDSPATPISIVEADEVIGSNSETLDNNGGSPISPKPLQHHSLTHPDQLRQHLEQMYQTSQLAAAAAAAAQNFGSEANQSRRPEGDNISPELRRESLAAIGSGAITGFDNCLSPDSRGIINDDTGYLNATSINSPGYGPDMHHTFSTATNANNDDATELDNKASTKMGRKRASMSRNENIASAIVTNRRPVVGLLNFAGPIYAGRRNSASESFSQPSSNRENAMQILALQKRYTNCNSLSSPSWSSPPSSTSPSSSSSSNQTSGNCSAATSFYASSSLSCSSPLLNLLNAGPFNSSQSPAFNQPVPMASHDLAFNGLNNNNNNNNNSNNAQVQNKYDSLDIRIGGTSSTSETSRRRSPETDSISPRDLLSSPDSTLAEQLKSSPQERDDSGIGMEQQPAKTNRLRSMTMSSPSELSAAPRAGHVAKLAYPARSNSDGASCGGGHLASLRRDCDQPIIGKLSRIEESSSGLNVRYPEPLANSFNTDLPTNKYTTTAAATTTTTTTASLAGAARFTVQSSNARISRSIHGHYNTLSRLNNYFMNRHPLSNSADTKVEFQCLDCDQFIDVDQATIMNKTNELRLLRATDSKGRLDHHSQSESREMTAEQLDRAYVAAMNGLPLCKSCEKKRIERKEIISEFVETELKYGRDLKIIHDEFYRPMQIAGLLSKEQINGVFLNLEELIMAHCKFADRLETAIREAHSMGDTDFNTVNIGRLFVESAEMLHTFESYCIRQGAAACLLARLAKEKELLRIFLRVSQMENTLLRRMNLAAFLMVPVQRVTKYPLLLNRLYKVTAYHHKDREALRDAQLKVELHLEHINQQTKGIGASNKIWRRISSLSAPNNNRRGLINAEDIGYIKLRKTAMDLLKWDRDDTQFIHSGKIHFAPLNEYLTRQKMKPLRYMPAHALLIVLGRPNWKYRPDLVKSNLDNKLMTPTPGGNGIKEAALLLFREKNGRFVPCREPLLLSNCVLSADCSQYNNECPLNQQPNIQRQGNQNGSSPNANNSSNGNCNNSSNNGVRRSTCSGEALKDSIDSQRSETKHLELGSTQTGSIDSASTCKSMSPRESNANESRASSLTGDAVIISSLRGLIEDTQIPLPGSSPVGHTSRSYSLASALPRTAITSTNSTINLSKATNSTASSNLTILNQLMTKVNSYHSKQSVSGGIQSKQTTGASPSSAASEHQAHHNVQPISSPSGSLDSNKSPHSSGISATECQPAANGAARPIVAANAGSTNGRTSSSASDSQPSYSYHYFHYNHHQPYGDYEESFEIHERVGKESMLLRADTPLKTRYWLQMLRYHAKDLGQWRSRRNGLANIMMMRHE